MSFDQNLFSFFSYSFRVSGGAFLFCLAQLALMLVPFCVGLALYGIVRRFVFIIRNKPETRSDDPLVVMKVAARKILKNIALLVPVVALLVIISVILGKADMADRTRLIDVPLAMFDLRLFGTFAFAAIGNIHWPALFVAFTSFSFLSIPFIIIFPALIMGYLDEKTFREMVIAFCVGTIMLLPLWILFPALSPQDRFVDNVYQLATPDQFLVAIQSYHPQQEIVDFLSETRERKAHLPAMPTSTMPSAHIFWIGFAAYYFFRSRKWLGWLTAPFLAASAFGTILFAQHYCADILASIVILIATLWITEGVVRRAGNKATKKPA